MSSRTIKNAVEAHGWVGVVVSVPLFIIFWAGAITLFHPEVSTWSVLPLRTAASSPPAAAKPSLLAVVEDRLAAVEHDPEKPIFVRLPSDHSPFLEVRVPLAKAEGGEERAEFIIDPESGETLATGHPFELSGFLYALHYNLKLPQGLYIVGLVTLFFMVLLMTGLVIQLKLLFKHFFLYRHDKGKRMRTYDLHSVTGVVTLPFALLYSLTGLMFNLNILFYLPVLMLAYGGDQVAMMKDAGFSRVNEKPAGVAAEMPALEPLIHRVQREHDAKVLGLNLMNFGDRDAIIRLTGVKQGFGERVDVHYEVKSGTFPERMNVTEANTFSSVVMPLFMLHMGKFGGPGVRFIFFVLSVAICGMIIAGNVLWLIKRESKLAEFPRSYGVIRGLTLGACTGTIVATCAAFLLERTLPTAFDARATIVQWAFFVVLAGVSVLGFFVRDIRAFLGRSALASAALCGAVVVVDMLVYRAQIATLWRDGDLATGAVTIGLALTMAFFAWLGVRLQAPPAAPAGENVNLEPVSASSAP